MEGTAGVVAAASACLWMQMMRGVSERWWKSGLQAGPAGSA